MQANKKRLIQNLLLLILVAGLVFFITTREEPKEELHKTLYDKSFGDEVTKITLHVKGNEDIVLQSEGKIWKVTQPEAFTADTEKVRLLFTLLSENADSSYSIEGRDLAQYGLDADNLSIQFNQVKLIFGKYNDVTQQRYVLKGDHMYLISETISGVMKSGADAFKPKN